MNVVFKSIFLALALGLSLGCGEPSAQVSQPKLYSKDGVEFRYPGNWKVTEDASHPDFRYIIVESPGGAVFGNLTNAEAPPVPTHPMQGGLADQHSC